MRGTERLEREREGERFTTYSKDESEDGVFRLEGRVGKFSFVALKIGAQHLLQWKGEKRTQERIGNMQRISISIFVVEFDFDSDFDFEFEPNTRAIALDS